MNQNDRAIERGDLWHEILETEGGDVNEVMRRASEELEGLIAYAAEWDADVAMMRDTAPARSVAYGNAQPVWCPCCCTGIPVGIPERARPTMNIRHRLFLLRLTTIASVYRDNYQLWRDPRLRPVPSWQAHFHALVQTIQYLFR